jgi:hypothetical protein
MGLAHVFDRDSLARRERPAANAVGFGLHLFEEIEERLCETMLRGNRQHAWLLKELDVPHVGAGYLNRRPDHLVQ